mgnify:CR=1 FL=1
MIKKKHKIICDECKKEFFLKSVKIKESIVKVNNVPINLVYFMCPKCKKIYLISIQDKRYFELLDDLENTKRKKKKNNGTGDLQKAEILNEMVFRKLNRLKSHEEKLKKKVDGTFICEEGIIKYLP